jgi:hypothetical protein
MTLCTVPLSRGTGVANVHDTMLLLLLLLAKCRPHYLRIKLTITLQGLSWHAPEALHKICQEAIAEHGGKQRCPVAQMKQQ